MYDNRSNYLERTNAKRMERALKTKDIDALSEDEDDDDYWEEDNYQYGTR